MKKKKKVTIKDIAKETSLSIATVSRVINKVGGQHYSEKSKKIIEDAIKRLNYKPDMLARGLKKRTTKTIGFIVPELDSFYSEIFLGAQDVALKCRYSTFLCDTNYNKELEKMHLENLLNRRVDGVIITTGLLDNNLVYTFLEEGIPVVLIENFVDDPKIPAVVLDNYKYAKIAVKHLIDNGYRKIGYISAPVEEMYSLKERYNGYKAALKENGVKLDKSLIYFSKTLRGEWDLLPNYMLIENIMSKTNHPDALFIISDTVAMVALQVIKKMGYIIPDDVGVVGFDDRRLCKYLDTPLTSVCQPKYEMGSKGMKLLLKIIEGEEIEERNIYLDMGLSVRKSSDREKK